MPIPRYFSAQGALRNPDPIDSLMEKLVTLEAAVAADEDLFAELRRQQWIIESIEGLTTSHPLATLATRLLHLLSNSSSPSEIRTTLLLLRDRWKKDRYEQSTSRSLKIQLATWASTTAILSGLLAILLGNQGLLFIIQRVFQITPRPPAPEPGLLFSTADFMISSTHALIIALLLGLRFSQLGSGNLPSTGDYIEASSRQFLRGWTGIWLAWLGLYCWLSLGWGLAHFDIRVGEHIFWSVADIFNVATGVAFLYAYLVLDMPSVPSVDEPTRDRDFQFAFAGAFGLALLVALISVLGRLGQFGLGRGGPLVQTLFVAVAMAFFFARLDSHYMNIKRWLLAPFYLYVAIQITWTDLAVLPAAARTAILTLALILKIYLFFVVSRWIQTGRVWRYLERAAREHPRIVEEDRLALTYEEAHDRRRAEISASSS